MSGTVLITGGTGYIGAHTVVVFQQAGYQVVILDNLCNSSIDVVGRIAQITGHVPLFVQGDIRDDATLNDLMSSHDIQGIVHLAGLKAVGESVQQPLTYHENNVQGSLQLLKTAQAHGVNRFVFSSSATVYGEPQHLPIDEKHPADRQANPYGRNKRMVELMLQDAQHADPRLSSGRAALLQPDRRS